MKARLWRLLRDPVGVARRRLHLAWLLLRFGGMRGERARRFWRERHARYGLNDLRGVGRESWTHDDNARDYARAYEVVAAAWAEEGVDLPRARVLDVGCGTGYYAERLRSAGVVDYTGLDLADTLLPALRARHPGFRFLQRDVTCEPADGPYDLVLMIDVTQHLVDDADFRRAMAHLGAALAPGGLLLVTSWLTPGAARSLSFYERARPRSAYREAFPAGEFRLGEPRPFREKWLLPIRRLPATTTV